jgi:ABC-2 type transport system ATP-binding protein
MSHIIEARNLRKHYGRQPALDGITFNVEPGRIVGLVGRNGAGKTTALKAILGLIDYQGELNVLGLHPKTDRDALMQQVCFIADTAVLPRWMRVAQAIDLVAAVHPRFDRTKAEDFLKRTNIRPRARVDELSKGMVTELHLALILAIDARLLVLDEPTLGLDLIYRRQFYDTLLNDYLNKDRTILLTTHQVEEIEHLVTDVLFIEHGKLVLNCTIDELATRFQQLVVAPDRLAAARSLGPINERELLGRNVLLFENQSEAALAGLGEIRTPSISDLFVARLQGSAA